MEQSVIVAGNVRKVRSRPAFGRLRMDCPYCQEKLEVAPRGGLCRHCGSTIGVESTAN